MPLTDYSVIYGGSYNPPHFGHAIAAWWMVSAISSSQIRSQLRRDKDITGLIPKSVKEYIKKNGLYK